MRILYKILTSIIFIPILAFVFLFGGVSLMEGYNIFDPYIDTEFSENYTPEKFDLIQMDLSMEEVVELIGEPLRKWTLKNEIQFLYTRDSFLSKRSNIKYLIRDFAWYRSSVYFDGKGQITKIEKGWSYD
ncbi:hypothetical protein SAMN05421824_0694 [Hyunsoonleella jejuensis]|uniref:Lipoprotein SmpA/OmlA domain-containing protein n=1 Tax=Hyunsoonleella jejuensis TaxID=419940 RepID=A0A1H9BUW4_9FLAO|nr:hypothetical protein [Hyunsoonleella jejuensis]SEP92118.1 hypothetical protein SAMN05421824_0694 [Hyunsoonleella jejuensis]